MRVFQMQRLSAIALLVLLTIHMVVIHYPPFHIDFSRIIDRMAQPLWKGIDIALLFFVLVHALTGMHAVHMDIEKLTPYRRALAAGVFLVGVIAFIYGTMTVLAFQPG